MNNVLIPLTEQRLDSLYEHLKNAPDVEDMFKGLIEYVALFHESKILTAIVCLILEEEKTETEPVTKLGRIVEKKFKNLSKKLSNCVNEAGIENNEILFSIEQLNSSQQGLLASTQHPLTFQYECLADVFQGLATKEFKRSESFIQAYGDLSDLPGGEHALKDLVFEDCYQKWNIAFKNYKKLEFTKVFFAWRKINEVYLIFKDFENEQYRSKKSTLSLKNLLSIMKFQGINKLISPVNSTSAESQKRLSEYRHYIDNVHFYTKWHLESLSQTTEQKQTQEVKDSTTITIKYDNESGVLFLPNNNEIKFRGYRKMVLEVIMSEATNRNILSFDEIYEKIKDIALSDKFDREESMKIYEAISGISARLAEKAGINDIFELTMGSVKLNDKYHYTS